MTYRGVGVQVSAHVFYLEFQLLLGALLGSLCQASVLLHCHLSRPLPLMSYLEGKVLEEVGSAVGLVRLCAASCVDPNTDGRRLGPWGVLGSDLGAWVNCSREECYNVGPTVKPFPRVVDSVFAP